MNRQPPPTASTGALAVVASDWDPEDPIPRTIRPSTVPSSSTLEPTRADITGAAPVTVEDSQDAPATAMTPSATPLLDGVERWLATLHNSTR
jgi:hypothetical protein